MTSAAPVLSGQELRAERRVGINSIVLPFLGSREEDFVPFQYLLADLSLNGARILLPRWLTRREWLRTGDEVDFHAPFRFAGETYTSGNIVWVRWEEALDAWSCGVSFARRKPALYPIAISFDTQGLDIDLTDFKTPAGLMLRVLKDAVLLKRGIRIYLKHLAPYLSRISGVDKEDYAQLRAFLLDDAARHVERNQQRLEATLARASDSACSLADLEACLNVEDLLDAFEPEIPAEVFTLAFADKAVAPYLRSIKMLEKKLYTNYNTLMLLYIQTF